MGTMLGALLGLVLGWGASRLHPYVYAGQLVAAIAGLVGGLLGRAVLASTFTPMLADAPLAGAAAGGAIGGLILAPLAGFGVRMVLRRLASRDRHDH